MVDEKRDWSKDLIKNPFFNGFGLIGDEAMGNFWNATQTSIKAANSALPLGVSAYINNSGTTFISNMIEVNKQFLLGTTKIMEDWKERVDSFKI